LELMHLLIIIIAVIILIKKRKRYLVSKSIHFLSTVLKFPKVLYP
jgi:hypothetical protein